MKTIKKVVLVGITLFLVLFLVPINSYAIGWVYDLGPSSHWGSSGCQTSYPNLIFEINQESGGYAAYNVEVLRGGSWVDHPSDEILLYGTQSKSIKIPVESSTIQYRIFVKTPNFLYTFGNKGTIKCVGSR